MKTVVDYLSAKYPKRGSRMATYSKTEVLQMLEEYAKQQQVSVEPEVKPDCEQCCLDCRSYEMTKEEHLENFCSQWCIRMDKLFGWNVEIDSCSKYTSKSV